MQGPPGAAGLRNRLRKACRKCSSFIEVAEIRFGAPVAGLTAGAAAVGLKSGSSLLVPRKDLWMPDHRRESA